MLQSCTILVFLPKVWKSSIMALLNKAVEIFNCDPKNSIINSYCTAICF
jgi:hypothetical protein